MKKSLGYSKLILSIMDMYSKNTILKVADFVRSPNQVKESQGNSRNFENSTDGRGIQQKDRYANFSRDVDYAEYTQHIVRFLKQI